MGHNLRKLPRLLWMQWSLLLLVVVLVVVPREVHTDTIFSNVGPRGEDTDADKSNYVPLQLCDSTDGNRKEVKPTNANANAKTNANATTTNTTRCLLFDAADPDGWGTIDECSRYCAQKGASLPCLRDAADHDALLRAVNVHSASASASAWTGLYVMEQTQRWQAEGCDSPFRVWDAWFERKLSAHDECYREFCASSPPPAARLPPTHYRNQDNDHDNDNDSDHAADLSLTSWVGGIPTWVDSPCTARNLCVCQYPGNVTSIFETNDRNKLMHPDILLKCQFVRDTPFALWIVCTIGLFLVVVHLKFR